MKAFVVDVNVPIVANGRAPQADLDCQYACVAALQEITESGLLVLDDQMRILEAYLNYLSPRGQPGLGDAFMRWVWEHQAVTERCEQVPLTVSEGGFNEFPDDPRLSRFDPSDRVYVAVAKASRNAPEVLNAVDRDWWEHREALTQNGVRVRFLCPQHMVS
jgi:hypothetical protein